MCAESQLTGQSTCPLGGGRGSYIVLDATIVPPPNQQELAALPRLAPVTNEELMQNLIDQQQQQQHDQCVSSTANGYALGGAALGSWYNPTNPTPAAVGAFVAFYLGTAWGEITC